MPREQRLQNTFMGLVLVTALLIVAVDQLSKNLALRKLKRRDVQLARGIQLSLTLNPRGMLMLTTTQVLFTSIICGTILLGWFAAAGSQGVARSVGAGLVLGGATSNLADRLRRGAIVDFVRVWRWPTFNLADAALCCGVAVSLLSIGW